MFLGRTTAGSSTNGQLLELDVIAAVVVGGTLLVGGRGTITGTVFGVLIFATLTNVFIPEQPVVVGAGRGQGRHHRRRGAAAAALLEAARARLTNSTGGGCVMCAAAVGIWMERMLVMVY